MNKLSPFRWFVLQNFPFIEADFDALTNYELMCKIVEYLNATIEKTNELGNQVEVLTNWFNNLDVQDEVDHKLDEMVEDGTLQEIIGEFLNVTKNVKMYGAVGDGTTDDTEAIVSALADLNDGETLFFPAGDYIVYSDYENNTNNPSYNLQRLVRLIGKKHICLMGESKATTRIRPPYQGRSGTKYYFPCTLTIQECEDVEIKGLTIESKGENYGSHDAMGSVTSGSQRATAMAVNGGSAVFVTLSKKVEIHDCNIRLAGSCSSLYFSTISDCIVHDCFLNVASLGYACVTYDCFVGLGTSYNEKGLVKNILCHAETLYQPENGEVQIGSNTYCGKGGVCLEGITNVTFYVDVLDSVFKDMYSGGTSSSGHNEGYGIVNYYTIGTFANNIIEDCNIGIKNMQLNPDSSTGYPVNINNNKIYARYTGIWMYHTGSNRAPTENYITNNNIAVSEISSVPDGAPDILKEKGGISFSGYNSYQMHIKNNIIKANKGIVYANQTSYSFINGNEIEADTCISAVGGGRFEIIKNNLIPVTEGVYIYPYDGSSANAVYTNIDDNNFYAKESAGNVARIQAGSYSSYINGQSFKGNKFWNCWCIQPQIKTPDNQISRCVLTATALQGSNTLLTFSVANTYLHYGGHKVIANDQSINGSTTVSSYDSDAGTVTFAFSGDIRNKFTVNNTYIVL